MTKEERLAFALAQLDRTQTFHGRIETRAAGLLTLNLAMAGVVALNLSAEILKTHWICAAGVALILIGAALACLIAVSFSHLGNKVRPSLIYFADISRQQADEYIAKVKTISTDDLLEDALCQSWRNSEILAVKFSRLNRSYILTCVSIAPWLLFLIGSAVETGAFPMLSK
jgi:hypothetical protein